MKQITDEIKKYVLDLGADAVGIASVAEIKKIVPEGYSPDDLLKDAKSVVVSGAQRNTAGTWLTTSIDVIFRYPGRGFRDNIPFRTSVLLERQHGHKAVAITPNMFDTGFVPVMSLKCLAEMAGLGTRSMAGGIILNKQYGMLGFGAVITTMPLVPDSPLAEPVCPHTACVTMWERRQTTPCIEACSAINGKIENGRLKEVEWFRQLCATRANTTMNTAFIRLLAEITEEKDYERRKYLALGQARKYEEDPGGRTIGGRCIECMRVCPVNRQALKL